MSVAAAFAIWAGVFRAVLNAFNWELTGQISFLSRDIAWMAPLGTLLLFALPAALLAGLAADRPRFVSLQTMVFLLAVPALLSVLLPFGRIHDAASLLLALGIAWRLAVFCVAHPARTARIAWQAALFGAGLTAAMGGGWRLSWAVSEYAAARKPPAAAGSPNVVIVVLDAVRASELSLYGFNRPTTPALNRWAKDGTVFDWAIAPSSWTLPSHESFFTGRLPGELSGTLHVALDASYPTLAEVLSAHGYRTAGFPANPYYTTRESGLARGFDYYNSTNISLREVLLSATLMQTQVARSLTEAHSWRAALAALTPPRLYVLPNLAHDPISATTAVGRFLRWQHGITGQPFFAFLNLFDAHAPYLPPSPWITRFARRPGPRSRYDGAIAYQDAQLDTLFQTLRRRGVLDSTLVIVTADHGEQFGEHRLHYHNNSLYLTLLHVPLLMRYPRLVPAGLRVSHPVGLRRLPATVLEFVRLAESRIPGPSLTAAWREPLADTEAVRAQMQSSEDQEPAAARGPLRAVVGGRWHYIQQADGRELLFDYHTDSLELNNLAHTPAGDSALPALRARAATMPAQH